MEFPQKGARKLSLHQEANEAFKQGNFYTALQLYTRILKQINPNDKDILANRSLAYLKFGLYKLALLDSLAVLKFDPSHEKALVRRIKSLWGLRRYEEAIKVIETNLSNAQRERPFYKELEVKSRKFLKQSKGEYDMCEMIKLANNECHEIGEYTGPIEVVNIPGKGRGVIATADLSPGQLVLVSKAFAVALMIETHEAQITTNILSKLIHADKKTREEFGELSACAGPNAPHPTWVWSNTGLKENSLNHEVNLRIIDNLFINYRTIPNSSGIWIPASYFNNDCIDANIHIQYFGDVMMIRALDHIKKGAELTINKFPPEVPKIRKYSMKEGKFECKCRLCIFEAQESEETKNEVHAALKSLRTELNSMFVDSQVQMHLEQDNSDADVIRAFENVLLEAEDISSFPGMRSTSPHWRTLNPPKAQLRKALKYFNRIAELRAENPSLNTAMFYPIILELASLLFSKGLYPESIGVLEAARPTCNSAEGIISSIIESDTLIISCYLKLGDYNKIMEWIGILKSDLVRAYGTVEILREIGKSFLTDFDDLEIGLDFFSL